MLLSVLLHLVLNEAEGAINDLLVELQLCLLLIQVFLRALDFHWVEVQELVLLLEDLQEALRLHPLMQDNVLNLSSSFNLLLILFLHHLHFIAHAINILIMGSDALFHLFLLVSNRLLDLLLLLARLSYLAIEVVDGCAILCILLLSLSDDDFLLCNSTIKMRVLLPVDNIAHFLDLLYSCCSCLEPLDI